MTEFETENKLLFLEENLHTSVAQEQMYFLPLWNIYSHQYFGVFYIGTNFTAVPIFVPIYLMQILNLI